MTGNEAIEMHGRSSWVSASPYGVVPGDLVRVTTSTRLRQENGELGSFLVPAGEGRHSRNLVWPTCEMVVVARVGGFLDIRTRARSGRGRRCVTWTLVMDPVEVHAASPLAMTPALWDRWSMTTENLAANATMERDPMEGPLMRSHEAGIVWLMDRLLDVAGDDPIGSLARIVHPNGGEVPLGAGYARDVLEGRRRPREWMVSQLLERADGSPSRPLGERSVLAMDQTRRRTRSQPSDMRGILVRFVSGIGSGKELCAG